MINGFFFTVRALQTLALQAPGDKEEVDQCDDLSQKKLPYALFERIVGRITMDLESNRDNAPWEYRTEITRKLRHLHFLESQIFLRYYNAEDHSVDKSPPTIGELEETLRSWPLFQSTDPLDNEVMEQLIEGLRTNPADILLKIKPDRMTMAEQNLLVARVREHFEFRLINRF